MSEIDRRFPPEILGNSPDVPFQDTLDIGAPEIQQPVSIGIITEPPIPIEKGVQNDSNGNNGSVD